MKLLYDEFLLFIGMKNVSHFGVSSGIENDGRMMCISKHSDGVKNGTPHGDTCTKKSESEGSMRRRQAYSVVLGNYIPF